MGSEPGVPASLSGIWETAAQALARGAVDGRHAYHWPALATVGMDGVPAVRTVVLRRFDPGTYGLTFYTDRRTAKAAELAANPRAAVHFYDPKARVQLRFSGTAEILTAGPVWQEALDRARQGPLLDYTIAPAPGTPIDAPEEAQADAVPAEETFAVIQFTPQTADYLRLSREGHRRAKLDFSVDPARATWLIP
ncbi:MAG: pyridoxamine 5'-phosphate oxidase family protein [Pseudomonadota bacterium]